MKSIIAFYYLLQGQIVGYTVSEYEALRVEENLPTWTTCEMLIRDEEFLRAVRDDLGENEQMRAECYIADDLLKLGTPVGSTTITN